jgi:hypothetical protein
MEKNLKIDTKDKTLLYFLYEKDTNYEFIKIGIVTHALTDKQIEGWDRYTNSKHPVSIQRRITQLQTGSPRKIDALAYFMYDSKTEARSVECKLHKHFLTKINPHSKEWFNFTKKDIKNILDCLKYGSIDKIADCAQSENYWTCQTFHEV